MSLYYILNAKTFVRPYTRNRCAGRLRAMLRQVARFSHRYIVKTVISTPSDGFGKRFNGEKKKKIINKINLNTYVNKLISSWATPGESTPLTGYIDRQTFIINLFSTYERNNRSNTARFDQSIKNFSFFFFLPFWDKFFEFHEFIDYNVIRRFSQFCEISSDSKFRLLKQN